jgi:hypothetical protein
MTFRVQLLRGLFHPQTNRYRIKKAEEVTNLGAKLALLYIFSIFIFVVGGFFGIGSESMSKEISGLDPGKFEMGKVLLLFGKLAAGILFPSIFIFLSALFFWIFTDISYMRIVIVQLFIFVLHLFEKAVSVPLFLLLDINHDGNPFSFGVIAQYLTQNEYIIHLLSEVTIFQLIIIVLQYYYLSYLSEGNKNVAFFGICLFYLIIWLISALLAYIKVSVFV